MSKECRVCINGKNTDKKNYFAFSLIDWMNLVLNDWNR